MVLCLRGLTSSRQVLLSRPRSLPFNISQGKLLPYCNLKFTPFSFKSSDWSVTLPSLSLCSPLVTPLFIPQHHTPLQCGWEVGYPSPPLGCLAMTTQREWKRHRGLWSSITVVIASRRSEIGWLYLCLSCCSCLACPLLLFHFTNCSAVQLVSQSSLPQTPLRIISPFIIIISPFRLWWEHFISNMRPGYILNYSLSRVCWDHTETRRYWSLIGW